MIEMKDLSSASRQVATYSAMNPILWKAAICSPAAMICAVFAPDPLNYMFFGLSTLPILFGCWGFAYFARTDPDRLQSETHLQKMTVLARMGSNTGEGAHEVIIPSDTPLLDNPNRDEGGGQ